MTHHEQIDQLKQQLAQANAALKHHEEAIIHSHQIRLTLKQFVNDKCPCYLCTTITKVLISTTSGAELLAKLERYEKALQEITKSGWPNGCAEVAVNIAREALKGGEVK